MQFLIGPTLNLSIKITNLVYKKYLLGSKIIIPMQDLKKNCLIGHDWFVYIFDNYGNVLEFNQNKNITLDINDNLNEYYLKKFRELEEICNKEIYTVNDGHAKVVFVGSCRALILSLMFEELFNRIPFFVNAQMGVSVAVCYISILNSSITKPPSQKLRSTFENADIIICESLKHQQYLNTVQGCENSIYKEFNLKKECKIVTLPNLNLVFSTEEIYDYKNKTNDEILNIKRENVDELVKYCYNCSFNELGDYIKNNILSERLFCTWCHPMPILFSLIVKQLTKNIFNLDISNDIFEKLNKINVPKQLGWHKFSEQDYILGLSRNVEN